MNHHRLHLNGSETKVIVITTPSSANKRSLPDMIMDIILPAAVARNIGVMRQFRSIGDF